MCKTLAVWTTFGIGGKVRRLECVTTREALTEFSSEGYVIGRGSNILVGDGGYDGFAVVNRYEDIHCDGNVVTVGSGTRLGVLCAYLCEQGLSGFEWAVGIPGSIGGAVKMNAGAFGGEVSNNLLYADIAVNGKIIRKSCDELDLMYRSSNISQGEAVISATFLFKPGDKSGIKSRMQEYSARRKATQPHGRSAGSIFKNPSGISIGKVLDEAGLKGLRRGGAEISREHANIIVNIGGATARNVVELIAEMKDALLERNISAREEIIYLGDFI